MVPALEYVDRLEQLPNFGTPEYETLYSQMQTVGLEDISQVFNEAGLWVYLTRKLEKADPNDLPDAKMLAQVVLAGNNAEKIMIQAVTCLLFRGVDVANALKKVAYAEKSVSAYPGV